jgi:hypothetical protein
MRGCVSPNGVTQSLLASMKITTSSQPFAFSYQLADQLNAEG